MMVLGIWFVLLLFEIGKLSKFPFQELCKIPSHCFGAWRVTVVKKMGIFVLFSKQGVQKNIQIYSCGGRLWFLQGHHVHSISWNALGVTFNEMLLNSFEKRPA